MKPEFIKTLKEYRNALVRSPWWSNKSGNNQRVLDRIIEWHENSAEDYLEVPSVGEATEILSGVLRIKPNSISAIIGNIRKYVRGFNENDTTYRGDRFDLLSKTLQFHEVSPSAIQRSLQALLTVGCRGENTAILKRYRHVAEKTSKVVEAFRKFLGSEKSIFAVVGQLDIDTQEAALDLLDVNREHSTYFPGELYRSTLFEVPRTVETVLAETLRVGDEEIELTISGINQGMEEEGKIFVVFLSGLERFHEHGEMSDHLVQWCFRFGHRYPAIRFCITCRNETWNRCHQQTHLSIVEPYFLEPVDDEFAEGSGSGEDGKNSLSKRIHIPLEYRLSSGNFKPEVIRALKEESKKVHSSSIAKCMFPNCDQTEHEGLIPYFIDWQLTSEIPTVSNSILFCPVHQRLAIHELISANDCDAMKKGRNPYLADDEEKPGEVWERLLISSELAGQRIPMTYPERWRSLNRAVSSAIRNMERHGEDPISLRTCAWAYSLSCGVLNSVLPTAKTGGRMGGRRGEVLFYVGESAKYIRKIDDPVIGNQNKHHYAVDRNAANEFEKARDLLREVCAWYDAREESLKAIDCPMDLENDYTYVLRQYAATAVKCQDRSALLYTQRAADKATRLKGSQALSAVLEAKTREMEAGVLLVEPKVAGQAADYLYANDAFNESSRIGTVIRSKMLGTWEMRKGNQSSADRQFSKGRTVAEEDGILHQLGKLTALSRILAEDFRRVGFDKGFEGSRLLLDV